MFIHRIQSPGLAHNSYYIADRGQALVCDPRRDVDVYRELARRRGDTIRFVLETHRNEDYAVGSTALAETGARVLHSAAQDFGHGHGMREGERIDVGRIRLAVMETTGHTRDSLCFAMQERGAGEQPFAVLTGDTLFAGDTGRVDLLGEAQEADLAEALYESVQRLLALGDGVSLLAAHGSGSVCGAGISERELSTLGFERQVNPRLTSGASPFVEAKLAEQHVRPPYFELMEEWNLRGTAPVLERLPDPEWLEPDAVEERIGAGSAVVDLRDPEAFAGGHIPGSYNLWMEGLPSFLGWIVEPLAPVTYVLPSDGSVEEAIRMSVRLGYDAVGVLRGGFPAWRSSGKTIGTLRTADVAALERRTGPEPTVLDVRTPAEWSNGSPEGALRIFVGELERRIEEVPRDRELVTLCGVGSRAGLAASILARHGFQRVSNLLGGLSALAEVD